MTNKEIADLFRNLAAVYLLKDERKYHFPLVAYQKAADILENNPIEAKDLWKQNKLNEIKGIGKSIAGHLDELFRTGKVKHFQEIIKDYPPVLFELIKISGLGPKRSYKLITALHLEKSKNIVSDLKKKALEGKIRNLDNFGLKSEEELIKNIDGYLLGKTKKSRMVMPFAHEIASNIMDYLKKLPEVEKIETLGSLRRFVSTIGDIDIAVATNNQKKVINYFVSYPEIKRILEKGNNKASVILNNGQQVDLMVQPLLSFGALLQHFTGSKSHNIRLRELAIKQGLSLSEYGIKKIKNSKILKYSTEIKFYQALGLPLIPPELREDRGEVEAGLKNKLPKLINLSDIKGDLHLHSNFNIEPSHDLGINSMEEMMDEGFKNNYEYLAFSEHSPSLVNHNSQSILTIIENKKNKIEQLNNSCENSREKRKLFVFNSLEIDILKDGNLSVPDKGLELLDFAIVSIHGSFHLSKTEMTKRVIFALNHPKVKILGHPTGRLLGERDAYELNWDLIFDFCLKNNKALEINSAPNRLDLPDILVREAVKNKVKMVINTDSHQKEQMNLMFYGVEVARRGWAEKDDIINTMSYNKFVDWINI